MLGAAAPLACAPGAGSSAREGVADAVTPVAGPSWLQHLGLSVEETKMGQVGGGGPAPASTRGEPPAESNRAFAVTGEDLYRFDCRSCHGPDGTGAPPEINSLVPPVQGLSAALTEQRMKERGRALPPEFIATMTAQAGQALRDRLAHGGKKMPSFPHLRPPEVNLLIGYLLEQLAHAPDAPRPEAPLNEPAVLVGEHLAKGTCHICHAATGGGGGMMMMMSRTVPSLATLSERLSPAAVAAKVIAGRAPMGMMGGMMASRMPILSYLAEQEVDAAHRYLRSFPPQ